MSNALVRLAGRRVPAAARPVRNPLMIPEPLVEAVQCAAEHSDFLPLCEHLAEAVTLTIAVAPGACAPRPVRGIREVVQHLADLGDRGWPALQGPVEMVVSGKRIVAFRDERVTTPTGLTLRCECALVCDVRDDAIVRLAFNHELSPVWDPAPAVPGPSRRREAFPGASLSPARSAAGR
jgi:ketosteroid isomerase-like protein